MTFQVGRIIGLNEPRSWENVGSGRVIVVASYRAKSITDGLVKRDQLLGYPNDDEPVIPVILSGEPRVTGYYRPVSARILTDDFTRLQGNLYDYQLELEPVNGFTQPLHESVISGALMTNSVGAVAADMWPFHAVPAATTEYLQPFGASGVAVTTRVSADGGLILGELTSGATSASGSARFTLAPASFYVGAATFEQGSPLQPVVGRAIQADVLNWRLSNGLVRVTPNASGGKLDVSHYNGSTWSAVKTYKFTTPGGPPIGWNTVTILRNAVEEVAIRLSIQETTAGGTFFHTLDIALRRGDRVARLYFTASPFGGGTWSIFRNTVEAATAVTFGAVTVGAIRATSNDGDGNRYVLLSFQGALPPTNDLVNGGINASSAGSPATADFGIGSEIGGSGAAGEAAAASIARQYVTAQSESQRIVAR